MTYDEFKKMLLDDEDEPLTIDGVHFGSIREMNAFIRRLYKAYQEGN